MGAKFIMLKPICKKKLLGFLSRFVQIRFKTQNLMQISIFESVEKVAKGVFYKCVLKFHFAYISGLGGFILSKKVKILCAVHTVL
jgi:hypothetical protein